MIPCWIIPIIVGLLCAVLGYFLGRYFGRGASNWKNEYEETLEKLNECRKKQQNIEKSAAVMPLGFNAEQAKMALGKTVKENDLTLIEGIGPKIEELLNASGITTWKKLSETSISDCKDILEKAGNNYAMHNPATWSEQATLAYEGKWKELKKWQDELSGGI